MPSKKTVGGVVDRVEGDVVVIVVKDPGDGVNKEIYVKKKSLKKVVLKEGDQVTVEMSQMAAEKEDGAVQIIFTGVKPKEMAKRFFAYLVDGGLEDQLIENLSGKGLTLEIRDCDPKKFTVIFQCLKEEPAKKPVKKASKKVPAKRTKNA